MAFFSVVIPVYNKANFLAYTLGSVISQEFKDFEIILVNDGSTDNSLEVLHQFKDERIKIFNQKNQGASSARNLGVEKADSKWIALLDADDFWYADHLQELYNCIQKFSEADVVSNAYEIKLSEDYTKTINYSRDIPKKALFIEDYFSYSYKDPLFWTSTIAFKKECFKKIGGFDTDLKTGQDLDLIIRFALNFNLYYNPKVTLKYIRFTENNLSIDVNLEEKKKYIDKSKLHESNNCSLKKYLDINRYSLALQAKMNHNKILFKQTFSEIDMKNLSSKQRILIKLPGLFLKQLKNFQWLLIKMGIYKSAF
jgi:glycosyltransferase involved in cell wall biosynthesis